MSERSAPCPHCGQAAPLGPGNPWRPFCSQRCKLIDLGDWMSGRHGIPAEEEAPPAPSDEDETKPS